MSISGGVASDKDLSFYANENWPSTGSRGTDTISSSNLFVGGTTTGSISEIRTWINPLTASKFRLHTLNKFSTVGNTINSHQEELIYHYKLNENYSSSSLSSSAQTTLSIIDSAPKQTLTTNYTMTMSMDIATGSLLYGFDMIDMVTIGLQDANQSLENNNKIIVKPQLDLIRNLSPHKPSVKSLYEPNSRPKRTNSTKLEINRSPQDYVNNFILEKIQG